MYESYNMIYIHSNDKHSVSRLSFAHSQSLPMTISESVQYLLLSWYLHESTLHLID